MKTTTCLLTLLILLAGCSSVQNNMLTDAEKESVKKEVHETLTQLFNVLRANDHKKIVDFFDMENDFHFVLANANEVFDATATMEIINEVFPLIERQEFETIDEVYTVISRDMVISSWHGKNVVQWKDGKTETYDDYWSSFTFKRTDGNWKIIYVHESVFLPAMQVLPETAP
jgi:hypothetical protein